MRYLYMFLIAMLLIGTQPATPVSATDYRNPQGALPSAAKSAPATSVTIAGDLQSEAGCGGDWDPACAATHLTFDAADQVWQGSFSLPSGSYNYKAALDDSWTVSYGENVTGGNIGLTLGATTSVKFYYSDDTHWVADNVNKAIATVAGNFQSELGCPGDWQPDCLRSWLQDPDGDGIYTFSSNTIPVGSYNFKVALNEGWATAYPGSDLNFTISALGQGVDFTYNSSTNAVGVTVQPIGGAIDNNVLWGDLYHDSRNTFYRTPGGAVPAGTAVTLRFRAAKNDLTAAKVRVWDDRNNTAQLLNMSKVTSDTFYDYWEATIPSTQATIFWYRFIAQDGTASAYYEDDAARLGGVGGTLGASADRGWQLTVYDPAFTTPAWVKNAVIYQIFPDRFRDGTPGNNPASDTFFYDETPGTIVRSLSTNWNEPICDPRAAGACAGSYSKNFYGGDLQGVIDKLDYLQGLGVTAIYFNPIFLSPSNHKYDTADYGLIDPAFGSLSTFQTLATQAHARGMNIILDGVFNHVSSDSKYFDLYARYGDIGACESTSSPYRDWFYLPDIGTPGKTNGVNELCATNSTYEAWYGYSSLPKLQANSTAVRDLIWNGATPSPTSAIARYWLAQGADGWRLDVGGDVDPGLTNESVPNNYWEGFRTALHLTKPEAYITGEEWGNASPWVLGNEWDAVMNYQFSSAVLSFWRDTTFSDNDHNTASSAGELTPLSPSQLNERLLSLQERYPPEALYAMMNLLDSHDTSRALFMLDGNAGSNNPALYQNANYDWSDAIKRLKGVALLQMTLPGAPTIYYGDEVGLVGPMAYSGGKWEDDPYNRQPYPWLDNLADLPFYNHLKTQPGQDAVLDYYKLLTGARNTHAALRTGDFKPLKVDDTNKVYVYGRKMADNSDAAIVIVNRNTTAQTVVVDTAGYLATGAVFADVLNGGASHTIAADGQLTVANVPAMNGAVLVLSSVLPVAPAAVTDLAATGGANQVDLSWSAATNAASYDVYRSVVSGGGYSFITNIVGTTYSDTSVANATTYYYVLVSRGATGLASGNSNQDSATPQWTLGWYDLQWPPTIDHTLGITPTVSIYGQVWIDGGTDASGSQVPGVLAQVGFGLPGDPYTGPAWTWSNTTFDAGSAGGNNDQYIGTLLPTQAGVYNYLYRYSTNNGQTWSYAWYQNPVTSGGAPGVLTVTANPGDTTPPAAPANLNVTYVSGDLVSLQWNANTEPDLGGYEVYRKLASETTYGLVASVGSGSTGYTDTSVVTNSTYDYSIKAFDTSYNRSISSNIVTIVAAPRYVDVTFNLTVPASTPTSSTAYIAGSLPAAGVPSWNPSATPMTRVDATHFSITLSMLDGSSMEYKYTRGSWEVVEKQADGNTEILNRIGLVAYGAGGTQTINDTVANWRDPLVSAFTPADGAVNQPNTTTVTATWNQAMTAPADAGYAACITVTGPGGAVTGTVTYDNGTRQYTFTPSSTLGAGLQTVNITGCKDAGGDTQQVARNWTFQVADITVPTAFIKYNPVNSATGISTSPLLSWQTSIGAASYEYCLDTIDNSSCDTGWVSHGTNKSVGLSGLAENTTYYWQVRAVNAASTTYADGGAWWNFTTMGCYALTKSANPSGNVTASPAPNCTGGKYLSGTVVQLTPVPASGYVFVNWSGNLSGSANPGSVTMDADKSVTANFNTPPTPFIKYNQANGATGVTINPLLNWGTSINATSYEYCIDTSNDTVCDTGWVSRGSLRSVGLSGLLGGTTYYWQAHAVNDDGTVEANSGAWWSFTTLACYTLTTNGSPSGSVFASPATNCPGGKYTAGTVVQLSPRPAYGYTFSTWSGGLTGSANPGSVTMDADKSVTANYIAPPTPFSKYNQVNGATGVSINPLLNWGTSINATSYEYCIDTIDNGSCDTGWVSRGAFKSVGLSGLTANTTYYWQARAVNGIATVNANGGTWWSFTTAP